MPMDVLLGKPPKMHRRAFRTDSTAAELDFDGIALEDALHRVLQMPAVADKSFLIHIGDRTVGGLTVRDQLVGPWQVPVSDVAITASGFESYAGEAMAMGERTPLAILDAPASGRIAVAEALTNISAASIDALSNVRLSANWMAAAGQPGEDAKLFDTVAAVSDLCRELGIAIPVGKDSLSMRTHWRDGENDRAVTAPVSLIVSAFSPVSDVRRHVTPDLKPVSGSVLLLVDLGAGANRLGGSALAQAYGLVGGSPPDVDESRRMVSFVAAVQSLLKSDLLLAYHDRSDGGLITTIAEMTFAGRCGASIRLEPSDDPLAALFSEELGAVLQIDADRQAEVARVLDDHELPWRVCGAVEHDDALSIVHGDKELLLASRTELQLAWSETSYRIQALAIIRGRPRRSTIASATRTTPD